MYPARNLRRITNDNLLKTGGRPQALSSCGSGGVTLVLFLLGSSSKSHIYAVFKRQILVGLSRPRRIEMHSADGFEGLNCSLFVAFQCLFARNPVLRLRRHAPEKIDDSYE